MTSSTFEKSSVSTPWQGGGWASNLEDPIPGRGYGEEVADELALGPVLRLGSTEVRTGTCSWTDPTLVKESDWYPRRSMSAADRLAWYSARFPLVEADGTYYAPPSMELGRQWVERTPPGFVLNVKAYALLTGHPARPASLWADLRQELAPEVAAKRNLYAHHLSSDAMEEVWARFVAALRPLHQAGKLGAVLLQYPEWFGPKADNRAELARAREHLGDLPGCVELRSPRWLAGDGDRDRTLALLGDLGLSVVVVDAPPSSGLETVLATTTDLAVVRFHGRSDPTWKQPGISAAERFRYLYDRAELTDWVPKVRQLADQAERVHLLFNNCYRDFGVRNAAELAQEFQRAGGRPAPEATDPAGPSPTGQREGAGRQDR